MTAISFDDIHALRRQGEHEQARQLALKTLHDLPDHAGLHYLCACIHDALGLEAEAIPHYQKALALGLPDEDAPAAWLGLGSSQRALGHYPAAEATLREGAQCFPAYRPLQAFLAMALYNRGHHHEAMQNLLTLLLETCHDEDILAYQRAIRFYAQNLDQTWPTPSAQA